ncbi:MAG: FAD:protein FMN transferase [Actinobacteria bacterium]|nr:FAD:protein FMN transferase [Actinomycetota bacterium]
MNFSKKILKPNKYILSVFSFLILSVVFLSFIPGCYLNLVRTEETRDKIGTYVDVVIYATTDQQPEIIIGNSFEKLDELAAIFSNYDEKSSISLLNSQGFIENPPGELIDIIELSVEYNKITEGAFEITVDPLLTLWSEGLWKEPENVQKQKIDEALGIVGSDMIEIKPKEIRFLKDGMSATLGGIAKGYIVDGMMEYLKSSGVKNAIINAGGDISTMGSKPDGGKWIVSLENPDNTREKIVSFALSGESIATSGNYYRYFDPDKEVHHIIDPRTGYSANNCISSTVIAANATVADILATSVFVLGPQDGMKLVENLEGVEAFIIDNDRNIYKSSGIDKYIK